MWCTPKSDKLKRLKLTTAELFAYKPQRVFVCHQRAIERYASVMISVKSVSIQYLL